ncbi:bifunctional metallophosphatase/5'-nucleotidase [Leptolyngbya sp. PCC 6406]|uniref:bifunctional metallophosphatase/5'-nucleotidase n=1 Tax=Leptolyngbya sp. PCC 6406 TaxID=1173264 RepID=UPI0002ABC591|nr:bifunctional metallophosphatase/5'-nucleotidase [Leptolyngbya sp. PCC 6406]
MFIYQPLKRVALVAASLGLLGTQLMAPVQAASFTIFHNNDGESKLTPSASGEGGAASFVTLINSLQQEARDGGRIPVTISSGDNFLAGTAFNASLQDGIFYDALVLNAIGYDAIVLGNHDFDFGPNVLADFINAVDPTVPYLSANLDFSGEAQLQALVNTGRIAKSTIIEKDGERLGIVGATTTLLSTVSSPRNVVVNEVLAAVQAEIDALEAQGVNKIILASHLQSINEEISLVSQLRGVDLVIAGGGSELLTNDIATTLPSDQGSTPFGPYPLLATNADGVQVPVVTTTGEYRYVGRLEVEFDDNGLLTSFNGNPVRVLAGDANTTPDPDILANAVAPVQASQQALAQNVIGQSEVGLNGVRSQVRTTETNFGNLIADSLLWTGQQKAGEFGIEAPVIALHNGGGIRNDSVLSPGNITELNSFDALPFGNFVSVVPGIDGNKLKALLENAVVRVEFVDGRFAQIAGFQFGIDLTAEPGQRVVDVTLDDGTQIISNGQVLPGAPTISIATIDFLARGGDSYPFGGVPFTNLGVTNQQSLANYIQQELGGTITAARYPAGGSDRIFATTRSETETVPEPTALLGLVALGALGLRQRRSA